MKAGKTSKFIVLTCFLGLLDGQTASARKMYRLEDEKGKTLYTDQIPAEKNVYQQEILNAKGRPIQAKEKAKSLEQQILENRLAELRKEAAKLIARQKIHDDALLGTFHSSDEIAAALTAKMQGFDGERKVIETNLKNATEQLNSHFKTAADFERNGQQVPEMTLSNIKANQQQIEKLKLALRANLDRQKLSREEYNADIQRFLFLTQTTKKSKEETLIPSIKEANSLGLFYCDNDHQCNKAWTIARNFIDKYSTTEPNIFNDKLIMNRPPSKDTDISLSLSRIALTDNDYLLFLDIICQESAPGRELCSSSKVKEIRSLFRPFINNALSRTGK